MKKKTVKKPSPESLVQSALEDLKARDIVVINVRGISDMFDTLVVATGTSNRQVRALAEHVMEQMKKNGYPSTGNEGLDAGEWALVDFGDIVVHVMLPETRSFYDIEGLWHVPDMAAPTPAAEPVAATAATRSGKPRSPRAKASPAGTQPTARPARKAAVAPAAAQPGTRRKAASASEAASVARPRRTSATKPATGGGTGKPRSGSASKQASTSQPASGTASKARSSKKTSPAARTPAASKPARARRPKPAID